MSRGSRPPPRGHRHLVHPLGRSPVHHARPLLLAGPPRPVAAAQDQVRVKSRPSPGGSGLHRVGAQGQGCPAPPPPTAQARGRAETGARGAPGPPARPVLPPSQRREAARGDPKPGACCPLVSTDSTATSDLPAGRPGGWERGPQPHTASLLTSLSVPPSLKSKVGVSGPLWRGEALFSKKKSQHPHVLGGAAIHTLVGNSTR